MNFSAELQKKTTIWDLPPPLYRDGWMEHLKCVQNQLGACFKTVQFWEFSTAYVMIHYIGCYELSKLCASTASIELGEISRPNYSNPWTLEGKRLGVCRLFYKPIARFDTKLGYRRIKDFAEKNIHRSDKKRCGDILDFFMHSFYKQIYVPMLSSKENSINLVHVGK